MTFWSSLVAAVCFAAAAVMSIATGGGFTLATGASIVAAICFAVVAVAVRSRGRRDSDSSS